MPRYVLAYFSQNNFRNVLVIITGSIAENGKISGKLLTQLYFKVEDFSDHLSMYVTKSNVLFHYQALKTMSFFLTELHLVPTIFEVFQEPMILRVVQGAQVQLTSQ